MTDLASGLLSGGLALAGVTVGVWLNNRGEARRWRRDWTISRVRELRQYFGDVVEAMDRQFVVIGQAVEVQKRLRPPVPADRVTDADREWARARSRAITEAPANVENAVVAFDQVRARVATAVNAGDVTAMDAGMRDLTSARVDILNAINEVLNSVNDTMVPLLVPAPVRYWRRLRGRHSYEPAPVFDRDLQNQATGSTDPGES